MEAQSVQMHDGVEPTTQPPTNKPTTAKPSRYPTNHPTYGYIDPDSVEASFFCGTDWMDASGRCERPCPSGTSEGCADGEACMQYTSCKGRANNPDPAPPAPGNSDSDNGNSDNGNSDTSENGNSDNSGSSNNSGNTMTSNSGLGITVVAPDYGNT